MYHVPNLNWPLLYSSKMTACRLQTVSIDLRPVKVRHRNHHIVSWLDVRSCHVLSSLPRRSCGTIWCGPRGCPYI